MKLKKCAIVIPGFLPVPATKGGAVEVLIEELINGNEIEKKFSFEDKSKIFIYDVHEYFTTYYNNNDGSEDTKEVCLIRDGRRIVMHAKKIIDDQKEEIDRLNSIIRNLSLSINKQVLVKEITDVKINQRKEDEAK